jgi:molybdopterin adenylyltransferase
VTTVDQHRDWAGEPSLGFALVTASDSRSAAQDRSGALARELVEGAGHRIAGAVLVADEVAALRHAVEAALARGEVDVVLVAGGTGLAPRDVTVEALSPLFEKPIDGFGEIFRRLSYDEIGPAAMLSRAAAGTVGVKALFLLPGSPAAVRLALEALILPEIAHLLSQARR